MEGRVALVTGGAQGIGKALCLELLTAGAQVSMLDCNSQLGEATYQQLKQNFGSSQVIFLHCDVTDDNSFENCVVKTKETFGKLDILVNNAGIGGSEWMKTVQVNICGVIRGTLLALKHLARGGVVVNLSSCTALQPCPSLPVYSATKAAVTQLTRSYGTNLHCKETGIKLMAVHPGLTKTQMSERLDQNYDGHIREHLREIIRSMPSQMPGDVAKGILQVILEGENGSLWLIEGGGPPVPAALQ